MGNDGGVIAVQRRFMRGTYERKEDVQRQSEKEKAAARAKTCAISNEVLQEPVVVANWEKKDLVEVKLTPNPSYEEKGAEDDIKLKSELPAKYICPVTLIEMNGSSAVRGGVAHGVGAQRPGEPALQAEYGPFRPGEDVVRLAPPEEDVPAAIAALRHKRRRAREAKQQNKKREKKRQLEEREARGEGAKEDKENGGEEKAENADGETAEERKRRKKEKKEKKRQREVDAAARRAASIRGDSATSSAVAEAMKAVKEQKEGSETFKSLFNKRKETADDIFIRSGGMRYTLS
eukprot:CAMPEP_0206417102 /NCGR_PEP_ID=MMETSP0294-20121207/37128_1 /ASSEMBLY_ACC=CAM_ASM_000327 /TAXON_ID=39354 /ORGANISM="Heterosigma akashiwo, Strain CCMP2393" /LENGTH=290 /DNA_ID=CAMNT_0053879855 /DNA_START=148 /DNA_END=1020 /DNA_ORIENTATION=+